MFNKAYKGPMVQAFITQIVFYLGASCATDRGVLSGACIEASIIFWIVVAVLIWWQPATPSRIVLVLIRWGTIPVVIGLVPLILTMGSEMHGKSLRK